MSELKALVVDDEIHIVQVMAIKLKNNGYNVWTAEDGRTALDIALKEQPNVVITDYQMPGMTGLELVENLRKHKQTEHTPVIILTARGFDMDQQQMDKLKIAACLSKPFSPREVLACVDEVVGHEVAV